MNWSRLLARLPLVPDRVDFRPQQRAENCVQTTIAMALGLETQEVEAVAGTAGRMTPGEAFDLLDELGVSARPFHASLAADLWDTLYRQYGGRDLRALGLRLPENGEAVGHAYLLAGRRLYDPAGDREVRVDESVLRGLDWLAFFPTDLAERDPLEGLRAALRPAAAG